MLTRLRITQCLGEAIIQADLKDHVVVVVVGQRRPQAERRAEHEAPLQDVGDVLQLQLRHHQDLNGDVRDGAEDDVEHGEGDEPRGRGGEEEGQEVHEGDDGPAMEEEDEEDAQAVDAGVRLDVEGQEDDDAEEAGHQVVDQVPGVRREPEVGDADPADELHMLGLHRALLRVKKKYK